MWQRRSRRNPANQEITFLAIICVLAIGCLSYITFTGNRNMSEFSNQEQMVMRKRKLDNTKVTFTNGYQMLPRILCWIMTSPSNMITKALHVKRTWGRRCDQTLYFSSETDDNFPTIGLDVKEGKHHLTAKSQKAFRYIFDKHLSDADWFLKADDNTYIIIENLKYFLLNFSTYKPLYFGHHFVQGIEGGYMSGGAGYVLSKEALTRLAIQGRSHVMCRQDGGAEDVEIGRCLHNLGVEVGDSYDSKGRSRFHCFDPAAHLLGRFPTWYYAYDERTGLKGESSMSEYPVSFHYIKPDDMYVLHYFIYTFKLYRTEPETERWNTRVRG